MKNQTMTKQPIKPVNQEVVTFHFVKINDDRRRYLRALVFVCGKLVTWAVKFIGFGVIVGLLLLCCAPLLWIPKIRVYYREYPQAFTKFWRGLSESVRMLYRLSRRVPLELIVTWTRVRGGLRQSATVRPRHVIAGTRHRFREWDVLMASSPRGRQYFLVGRTTRSLFELW